MASEPLIEVQHTTAISAIEEAVRKSFWIQTQLQIFKETYYRNQEPKHRRLNEVLEVGTRAKCYHGSKEVVYELALKSPNLFKSMVLISTNLISDDSWLKVDADQPTHTYFLVNDTDGVWYAGSPANHMANKEKDYATTIIYGKNLDDVLERIYERDKAHFPTKSFIVRAITHMHGSLPRINNGYLNILEIKQNNDDEQLINHNYVV